MLSTSVDFTNKIDEDTRTIKALVVMHFRTDEAVVKQATASSQYSDSTPPSQACNGRINPTEYIGTGYAPTEMHTPQYGWQGAQEADAEGLLPNQEWLMIEYTKPQLHKNFMFIAQPGMFPVDFVVEARVDGQWVEIESVIGNADYYWGVNTEEGYYADAVRITVSRVTSGNVVIQEFGSINKIIYEDDDVSSISILEEVCDGNHNPIGNVTSNECTITLNNFGSWLSTGNLDSPFKGLLNPKVPFDVYMGVEVDDYVVEYVPMGKFKSTDWTTQTSSLSTTVVGYDKLQEIMAMPIPMIPVVEDISMIDLIQLLFTAIGLKNSEYTIDANVSVLMRMGWLPGPTVGDALAAITTAGLCTISIDRLDRIAVRSNFQNNDDVVTSMTHSNQLVSVDNPQKFTETYSSIKVDYSIPSVGDATEILNITELTIPTGGIVLDNLQFNNGPVYNVTAVKLIGSKFAYVEDIQCGAYSAKLTISNTGSPETVNLVMTGTTVSLTTSSYTEVNAAAVANWGEDLFTIESPLIQYLQSAQKYAKSLLPMLSDPTAYFTAELRGNPSVEPMDIISIDSPTDGVNQSNVVPIRLTFEYDGAISGTLNGRKPLILS